MNKTGLMLAVASMVAVGAAFRYDRKRKANVKGTALMSKEQQMARKGLHPFDIGGEIIYALNEKNAIRKYNKKHGL